MQEITIEKEKLRRAGAAYGYAVEWGISLQLFRR